MKIGAAGRLTTTLCILLIFPVAGMSETVAAEEAMLGGASVQPMTSAAQPEGSQQTEVPVLHSLPLLAEGSNSCEIVSCGMGIKQTCQITCPADKTPKCSCDCERSFGPMCMDYKANCRCE